MANVQQFPAADALYLAWLNNAATFAAANRTQLHLTQAQADSLGTVAGDFQTDYALSVAARAAAKQAVQTKDQTKKDGQETVRAILRQILNDQTIPDALKEGMGLRPHDSVRSPVAAPTAVIDVIPGAFAGSTLSVRLIQAADPTRRSKPAGVANYQVFVWAGSTPAPADLAAWRLAAVTGRDRAEIAFSPAERGQRALVVARAVNAKGAAGPAGEPVEVIVATAMAA